MDKIRRKRIFYVPGIISLLFIPITFIYFASKQQRSLSISIIPIFWTDASYLKKHNLFTPIKSPFPPKRNYVDIILTGNNKNDKTKLNFSQIRIKEILSTNDSINGLHFKFMGNSEYWTFIRTLDILKFEGAKTYMALDNNFWFYNVPPDTTTINWICGTTYNDNLFIKPKISFWEQANKQLSIIWNSSWKLIVGFLVFIFCIIVFGRKESGW